MSCRHALFFFLQASEFRGDNTTQHSESVRAFHIHTHTHTTVHTLNLMSGRHAPECDGDEWMKRNAVYGSGHCGE